MKKTVMTVIRVIVIVGVLGLLTYGGFLGMNRVSGNGDYTIDAYAATDATFHLTFSYSQITNSGKLKSITPAG